MLDYNLKQNDNINYKLKLRIHSDTLLEAIF